MGNIGTNGGCVTALSIIGWQGRLGVSVQTVTGEERGENHDMPV